MKLIPLSADLLQSQPFLPFGVYAEDGRMLLPAHAPLGDARVRARLGQQRSLFAQAADYNAWRRGMAQAVQGLLNDNAPLKQLAQVRPDMVRAEIPRQPGEEWEAMVLALDKVLQGADAAKPWIGRMQALRAQCRTMVARRMDEALFHLIYTGGSRTSHHSSRQALRCMLMAGEAALALGWDEERRLLLDHAALTMNAAAWRLHDQLARQVGGIDDPQQRALIASHPADGERLLRDSGVTDEHWLSAVRLHHDDALAGQPLEALDAGQAAASLLRRVDRYSAMLSRRIGREPLSATAAAQQACLGADGRPDPLGALMLKAVGLYPPGCFVALASNERGIVLARGERANQPLVAALVNAEGMVMAEPRLRDTSRPGLAVRTALSPSQIPVDPPLDKLQVLRGWLK
ncbi:HD-GYP domain-containing protein [Azohydromonas lata]|uniref:Phosphohydrolase n=1 Tax=Azohydromonas lata TaxID=45677 RepID=A0ABU5IA20_9BURK|nr:hypothetical protein [Azohydromonas lata]MDZ5455956.1 hypothetical protein [Azohydromonas lata]